MWMAKCSRQCNNAFDQAFMFPLQNPACSAPNQSDFEPIQRGRKRSFEVDICPFCNSGDSFEALQLPDLMESNIPLKRSNCYQSCQKFKISRVKRSSEESDFSNDSIEVNNLMKSHDFFDLSKPVQPTAKITSFKSVPPSRFHVDVLPVLCQQQPVAVDDLIQF